MISRLTRKEWFKYGEYIGVNVMLELPKESTNAGHGWGSMSLAERYIENELRLEIHYLVPRNKETAYFVAIVQGSCGDFGHSLNPVLGHDSVGHIGKSGSGNSACQQRRREMLIGIPETIKQTKEARPLRSVASLFLHNPLFDRNGQCLDLSFVGSHAIPLRETEGKLIDGPITPSYTPYEIIDGRPEIMDRVSNPKPETIIGLLVDQQSPTYLDTVWPFVDILIRSDGLIWVRLKEKVESGFVFLNAIPCPCNSMMGKFHLVKERLRHEGTEKNSKDFQGESYPHPETGRLLQESEESRHAVSVPPSEEVTSQTAPSRPRGDCTATHTRSNNPEGAS